MICPRRSRIATEQEETIMKLATLKSSRRDGQLGLVSRDLKWFKPVPEIAPTLQAALDDWALLSPKLEQAYAALNASGGEGAQAFDPAAAAAPLPRAYQWCDGSVFIAHSERMSKWRNMEVAKHNYEAPLVYQGGSDIFLGPRDPIRCFDEAWGIDFEAELAVITDDVPMGATPEETAGHIKLMMLANDVSLRNLIPAELARGFGFYQAKPSSAFSPVAVTLDELGDAWKDGKVHLPVRSTFRGELFGHPNAGVDMLFSFPDIVAYAARTRDLGAGSIFGSGTIANRDSSFGSSCITERRIIEAIESGESKTEYMKFGEDIHMEVLGPDGGSIFGSIEQTVVKAVRA
jgi:fumarylacetoacetate (FAA) hydrolase